MCARSLASWVRWFRIDYEFEYETAVDIFCHPSLSPAHRKAQINHEILTYSIHFSGTCSSLSSFATKTYRSSSLSLLVKDLPAILLHSLPSSLGRLKTEVDLKFKAIKR